MTLVWAYAALLWSYIPVAMAAFVLGVWAGVRNGRRAARVDAGFDELVRITTANMLAQPRTCDDVTERKKTP